MKQFGGVVAKLSCCTALLKYKIYNFAQKRNLNSQIVTTFIYTVQQFVI